MKVQPDGTYTPVVAPGDVGAINLRIHESTKKTNEMCGWGDFPHQYVKSDNCYLFCALDPCDTEVDLRPKIPANGKIEGSQLAYKNTIILRASGLNKTITTGALH
jgi:hypothetical protein